MKNLLHILPFQLAHRCNTLLFAVLILTISFQLIPSRAVQAHLIYGESCPNPGVPAGCVSKDKWSQCKCPDGTYLHHCECMDYDAYCKHNEGPGAIAVKGEYSAYHGQHLYRCECQPGYKSKFQSNGTYRCVEEQSSNDTWWTPDGTFCQVVGGQIAWDRKCSVECRKSSGMQECRLREVPPAPKESQVACGNHASEVNGKCTCDRGYTIYTESVGCEPVYCGETAYYDLKSDK